MKNKAPLYPATILDRTTQQFVYADSSGYYRIISNYGDTLAYSYLGYYTQKYVVSDQLTTNIIHNVQLISRRIKLKAVNIQALTPYQKDSLERAKVVEHYLSLPLAHLFGGSSSGVGISIHPITYFSKAERRKRHFHKMYKKFEKEAFIDSRYTQKLVHKLTGLTGDSLRIFMFYNRPTYDFSRSSPYLLFGSWIIKKYKDWLKNDSLTRDPVR